jgi:hypothetical protein
MGNESIRGKTCTTCGHIGEHMTYDEGSYDLADKFLPNATELERDDLASTIQSAIEDWLGQHGKDDA